MKFRSHGMVTAVAVVVVGLLAAAGDAVAQPHKMTRLGNPATRITAPISDTAGLQKTFTIPRNQAALSRVLDKAGLTSLTAQVLAAITEGRVTETTVAPGTTIQWMALRRAGRADIVSDAIWAGTAPFEGFAFSIDDGLKRYNFVVPKACGNLALVSVTEVPLPECVHVASSRSCESKQVTFTASGTAIATRQATKVSVYRDGRKVGEMLPEGFALALPVDAGRYTFMATDRHGREYGTCERDIMVEACAVAPVAPPPPPPPAPTSCGALLTATRVKGGLNMVIDGSASAAGASPATRAHIKLVGPDGNELTFTHGGTQMSEAELAPPFSATFFVAKARPGTYTLRAKTSAADPRAEARSCESTVYVPENDTVDWFIDGNGGKQRRQYDLNAIAPATGTITPGFCDPSIGLKAGPLFWLKDERVSIAPAIGAAFMFGDLGRFDGNDNDYNNVSPFIEGIVNVHFTPRGAYVGAGLGWWDVFDGAHDTGAFIANFGLPMKASARGDLFFVGEGRAFFDAPDGVSNNYQVWGGLRFIFR